MQQMKVTVHPRACGEHRLFATSAVSDPGSSPRMRGTPLGILRCWRTGRFIPAHAGNTSSGSVALLTQPVHPRACGEHTYTTTLNLLDRGSSPRMRGTRRRWPSSWSRTAVHPRACGEHLFTQGLMLAFRGSSPRMRGTPNELGGQAGGGRFIPAHAGNTLVRPMAR